MRFLNGDDRLSKLKVSCFVVIGAVAVTLAAYSAMALQRVTPPEEAANDTPVTQTSNRASKTNRLLVQTALASIAQKPVFALASAIPELPTVEQAPNPVIAAIPPLPEPAPAPQAAPPAPEPKAAKAAKAAPVSREKAPDKPKHLPPPQPAQNNGILDDGQIAGLRTRLQLSSDQLEYWPAVEAALREVVQSQLRGRRAVHGKVNIDVNSPEVQKLIYAAMPLLMRLREDQKGEVRKLARVIGLEQVASQI